MQISAIPDYEDPNFNITDVRETEFEVSVLKRMIPNGSAWSADLGCGYGRLSGILAERSDHTVFVDYSESNIVRARAKFADSSGDYHFILADIGNPPIRDAVLDTVTLIRVFHHFSNPYTYMRNISRCLTDGGSLIMNFDSIDNVSMLIFRLVQKITGDSGGDMGFSEIMPGFFVATHGRRPIYFHTHRFVRSVTEINSLYPVGKTYYGGLMDAAENYGKITDLAVRVMEYGMMGRHLSRYIFPNVFLTCRKTGNSCREKRESLQDILICPACRQDLRINSNNAICSGGHTFPIKDGIIDFRLK